MAPRAHRAASQSANGGARRAGTRGGTRLSNRLKLTQESVLAGVSAAYAIRAEEIELLRIGADRNTTAFRLVADDGATYFLKLRSGPLYPASVEIQSWLLAHGLRQVIAPIATRDGRAWTRLGAYAAVLYPFVEAESGMQRPLSDRQWTELGDALRRLHGMALPPHMREAIPREGYSDRFREMTRSVLRQAEERALVGHVGSALAALLREKRATILNLVERAERCAAALRERTLDFVLCHADLHANNVLIADDGRLFIVDWDTLLFAPKERDLMFIGGGVGRVWNEEREAAPFFAGYGATQIDPTALAYYRNERIVEDIADYCDQALNASEEAERKQALHQLERQFDSGDLTIKIALAASGV